MIYKKKEERGEEGCPKFHRYYPKDNLRLRFETQSLYNVKACVCLRNERPKAQNLGGDCLAKTIHF